MGAGDFNQLASPVAGVRLVEPETAGVLVVGGRAADELFGDRVEWRVDADQPGGSAENLSECSRIRLVSGEALGKWERYCAASIGNPIMVFVR